MRDFKYRPPWSPPRRPRSCLPPGTGPCNGPLTAGGADFQPERRTWREALTAASNRLPKWFTQNPEGRPPPWGRRAPAAAADREEEPRELPPRRSPGNGPEAPALTRPRGGARGTSQSPAAALTPGPGPARPGGHSHPRGEDLDAVLARHGGGGRRAARPAPALSPPPPPPSRSRDAAPLSPPPPARRCPGGGSTRMPERRPARRLWSRAPRGRGGKRRNWLPGLFVPPAGLRVRPARLALSALSREGAL